MLHFGQPELSGGHRVGKVCVWRRQLLTAARSTPANRATSAALTIGSSAI
jgi:hypothetical protein